jgi:hypothetical protein
MAKLEAVIVWRSRMHSQGWRAVSVTLVGLNKKADLFPDRTTNALDQPNLGTRCTLPG